MRKLPSAPLLLALGLVACVTSACDKGEDRKSADAEPDATKPDASKPDAAKPDAGTPDAGTQGIAVGEPSPAGTAGLTVVEGKSGIETDGAFVVIRGELKNGTDKWLSAKVLVDLLDASGKPLAVHSIQEGVAADLGRAPQEFVVVERDVIPPGESSPFEYIRDTSKLEGTYAKHTLVGEGREVGGVGRAEVLDFASKYDFGFVVSGKVSGTSEEPCEDPAVIVVLRDTQGTIVEVGGAPLMDGENFVEKLEKGRTLPFELTVGGDATAKAEALVRCEEPD